MPIKRQLMIFFSIFIALSIGIVGFLSFIYIRPQIKDFIFDGLKTDGYAQYQRVFGTVERYKVILEAYASRPLPTELLLQYYSKKDAKILDKIKEDLSSAILPFQTDDNTDVYKEVVNMGIIGKEGEAIAAVPDENFSPKCTEADVYSNGKEKNYFRVFKEGGAYYIEVCRPLAENGEKLGILAVIFNPKSLKAIASDYSIFGKTGETLIAFKNSNNEAEFFVSRRLENLPGTRKTVGLDETEVPITHALRGENTFLEHAIDYRGVPVIAATFFIPEANWGLVTKIDISEALAPINYLFILSEVLILLLVAAGILLAYLIIHYIIVPINKLSRLSGEVAKGNFNVSMPANLYSTENEIGQLAKSFFGMVADLRELYAGLDKQVAEKTKDLEASKDAIEKQKIAILNILEDVNEESKKNEFLAKDLQKFKLAVDNASDQITITDIDGTVLYANEAAHQITGYPVKEIVGQKAGKLWGGLMPKEFYVKMWDTIKNKKKDFDGVITNRRKNGEEYEASIGVAPILDNKGKIVFFVGLERDITKEKNIDRAKTEFVSLASHQLRTPLTAIKWYAETLKEEDGSWGRREREYLDEIYKGNERMIELVNALLNVSRIEMGAFTINPNPTDLVKIVKNVIKEQSGDIKNKKIKLTENYGTAIGKLFLDEQLTRIIFQNLLSNAVRYTKEGGSVNLRVDKEKKDILIAVKDNGIGVPKRQQDKIFDKLFRADNAREMDASGTGLGLYIAKAIVDEAGGKIWFESEEGKGSTFFVRLPLTGMKKIKGEKTLA